MQYLQKLAIPVLVSLIVSCGNSSQSDEANDVIDTSIKPMPGTTPVNSTPASNNITVPSINPSAPTAPVAVSASGLNPEHGKPGHRCDIAVGAPLDSKPAATPAAVTSTPSNPQNVVINNPVTTTAPAPAASKAGMNPEHGKPGHRCDIAVGAPLDSKPAANLPTTTTPLSLENSVPQPKTISTTPAAPVTATAPGMNPAHGQPGHRCDIAVGAPLNSKPISATKTEEKPKVN